VECGMALKFRIYFSSYSKEGCKEASHEAVRLQFVKLNKTTQEKCLDPTWSHFLCSEDKSKYNRYIALCTYCNKPFFGRFRPNNLN